MRIQKYAFPLLSKTHRLIRVHTTVFSCFRLSSLIRYARVFVLIRFQERFKIYAQRVSVCVLKGKSIGLDGA